MENHSFSSKLKSPIVLRYTQYADRVKNSIIELPRRYGFYEYFDPDTGQGHGSDHFSWTAALLIDLLLEEEIND